MLNNSVASGLASAKSRAAISAIDKRLNQPTLKRVDGRSFPLTIRRQVADYADQLPPMPIAILPDLIVIETDNFKRALGKSDPYAQIGHALAVAALWKELASRFTEAAREETEATTVVNDIPIKTELV